MLYKVVKYLRAPRSRRGLLETGRGRGAAMSCSRPLLTMSDPLEGRSGLWPFLGHVATPARLGANGCQFDSGEDRTIDTTPHRRPVRRRDPQRYLHVQVKADRERKEEAQGEGLDVAVVRPELSNAG